MDQIKTITSCSTTPIEGVFNITNDPGSITGDGFAPGTIRSLWRASDFLPDTHSLPDISAFCEDKISTCNYGTIKGFHGDWKTWKLVQCLRGSTYLVVLDNRKDSKTYGKIDGFTLNDTNGRQILIPPGVANAHMCLSSDCIFHYKQTEYYTSKEDQFSINPLSKSLNCGWPPATYKLSTRDTDAPQFVK